MVTTRQALKAIRADFYGSGENYLSGPLTYECDAGTIYVRNAPASDGGVLLGIFEAELVARNGATIKKYKV